LALKNRNAGKPKTSFIYFLETCDGHPIYSNSHGKYSLLPGVGFRLPVQALEARENQQSLEPQRVHALRQIGVPLVWRLSDKTAEYFDL
jgi:hypothetical protein